MQVRDLMAYSAGHLGLYSIVSAAPETDDRILRLYRESNKNGDNERLDIRL
jgi:hypothetical protein